MLVLYSQWLHLNGLKILFMFTIYTLAGLYSGTSVPQGKAGSATDVMSDATHLIVMNGGWVWLLHNLFNKCYYITPVLVVA